MSNVFAIHSFGESLRTYLQNSYPPDLRAAVPCEFRLVSSADLTDTSELDGVLTLYLYRITMNEHFRGARRPVDAAHENVPLSIDLHYLVTPWAKGAFNEHTILAWTMRQLQQHPVLDQSSLSPEAAWRPGEYIQVIPAELSTEDIMRVWDALEPAYRLSVSYIARVLRIDTDAEPDALPVAATRFVYAGNGQ